MRIHRAFGSWPVRDRRGIALVMVMLIVSTLMIIGILFSGSVTAEYRASVYYRQAVQSEQYCVVGMHRAMAELMYNIWGVNEDRPFVSARYNPAASGPDDNLQALGANEGDDFRKAAYYDIAEGSLKPITRQRGYWNSEAWVVWAGGLPSFFPSSGDPEVDGNPWNMDPRPLNRPEITGGAQRYVSGGQGTVSCTNGSKVVTGSGTKFDTSIGAWNKVVINGVPYDIASVGSVTSITLQNNYDNGKGAGIVTSGLGYYLAGSGSVPGSADGTLTAGPNPLANFVTSLKGYAANPRWINPEAFISGNASMGDAFKYGGVDLNGDGVVDDKDKALRDWALWQLKRDCFLPKAMSNNDLFEAGLHANNRGRWGNRVGSKDNAYEFISPFLVGDSFYWIFRFDPIYTMYTSISGEVGSQDALATRSDQSGYRYPYDRTHLGKDSAVALADDPVGGLVNINQVNNNFNIEEWTNKPADGATASQLTWYHINEAKWIYCYDPLDATRRSGRYAVTLMPDCATWNAAALHSGVPDVWVPTYSSPVTRTTGTVVAAGGLMWSIIRGFNPQTGDNAGASLLPGALCCYAPIRPDPLPNNWSNCGTDSSVSYFCKHDATGKAFPETDQQSWWPAADRTRAPEIWGGHGGSAWDGTTGVRSAIFNYLVWLGPYDSRAELATHLRKACIAIPNPSPQGAYSSDPAQRACMETEINIDDSALATVASSAQLIAALTTVHGYYYTLDRFWDRDLLFINWGAGATGSTTDATFGTAQSSADAPISYARLETAKDDPTSADYRAGQSTRRIFLSDLNNLECFGGYRTRDGGYKLLDYLFHGDPAPGVPGTAYNVSAVYGGGGTLGSPATWPSQKCATRKEKLLASAVSRVASGQRGAGSTAACANGHLLHSPQLNAMLQSRALARGTVNCGAGSATVTGTGTNFNASWVGCILFAGGGAYTITGVSGPTGLTISPAPGYGFNGDYNVTRSQASDLVHDEIGAGCPVCGGKLFLADIYEMNVNEVGRFYGKFRNAERPTRLAFDVNNDSQRPARHFVELMVAGRGQEYGATDCVVRFDQLLLNGDPPTEVYNYPAILVDPVTRRPYFSYDLEFDWRWRMTSDAANAAYTEGIDPEPIFRGLTAKGGGGGPSQFYDVRILVYDDNDNGGRWHDVTWCVDGNYMLRDWYYRDEDGMPPDGKLFNRAFYTDDTNPVSTNWVKTGLCCDEYYAMPDPDPAHRQADANAYVSIYRKMPVRWAGGGRKDTWRLHWNQMGQYTPLGSRNPGTQPTVVRAGRGVGFGEMTVLTNYWSYGTYSGYYFNYLYAGDNAWPAQAQARNNDDMPLGYAGWQDSTEWPAFLYKDPGQYAVVSFDAKFDGSKVAVVWGSAAGSNPNYGAYRISSYVELTDSVGNPQRISTTCVQDNVVASKTRSWQARSPKDTRGNADGTMAWDLLPMTLNGDVTAANDPLSPTVGYDPWWITAYGPDANWWANGGSGFSSRAVAQSMPPGYADIAALSCNNRNANQWNLNIPVRRSTFDGTTATSKDSIEAIYESLVRIMHDHCLYYGSHRTHQAKENTIAIPTGLGRQATNAEATDATKATYGGRQYLLGGTWREGNAAEAADPRYKWAGYAWNSWDKIYNVTDLCQEMLWKIWGYWGWRTAEDTDMYDANQDGIRDELSQNSITYQWSDNGMVQTKASVRGLFVGELRQINKLNLNELWYPPTFGGVGWSGMWYGASSSYTSFGRKPLKGFHSPSDSLNRHFQIWNADPGYNLRIQPWDLDADFSHEGNYIDTYSEYDRFDSVHCGASPVYTIYVTGNALDEQAEPLAEMRLRATVERTWDGRCNILEFTWLTTDRGFIE